MPAKVKTESKPAKKSAVGNTKKKKRKANLTRLMTEMNKLSHDANDKEIVKRFKAIIDSSEEDIAKTALDIIIKDYSNIELSKYHENLHPYIKHYLYMLKRDKAKKT